MAVQEFRFDPGANILVPAYPGRELCEVVTPGASLLCTRGQAMARKTSDGKFYPMSLPATDGTQIFGGFAKYSFGTDANGVISWVAGGTAAATSWYTPPVPNIPICIGGIFNPLDLYTSPPTGSGAAEVDTVTPAGTITAADNFVIELPGGNTVNFVAVSGSVTPTNIVTGLKTAWAADPTAAALATATGTATLILTAKASGQPMNLTTYCEGVGTFVNVVTPAVAVQTAEVDTFTYTTNPSTGDKFTLTITYPGIPVPPGTNTYAVNFVVGATQTVAAVTAGLKAAWVADAVATAYAVATSTTTTVVLTSAIAGNTMSIAATTNSGTTTSAKVVTTPALGRNIADILAGCPGARTLPGSGYWDLPY